MKLIFLPSKELGYHIRGIKRSMVVGEIDLVETRRIVGGINLAEALSFPLHAKTGQRPLPEEKAPLPKGPKRCSTYKPSRPSKWEKGYQSFAIGRIRSHSPGPQTRFVCVECDILLFF